jgi:hypothetical protein
MKVTYLLGQVSSLVGPEEINEVMLVSKSHGHGASQTTDTDDAHTCLEAQWAQKKFLLEA